MKKNKNSVPYWKYEAVKVYSANLRKAINLTEIVKKNQRIRDLEAENDVLKALLKSQAE